MFLTMVSGSVHNLLWDMEPPTAHQLRLGFKFTPQKRVFNSSTEYSIDLLPNKSTHVHVSQADRKLKKLEPDWANQLANFLANNKLYFQIIS